MNKTKENVSILAQSVLQGRPTKYDENVHIPLLIEVISDGRSSVAFCAKAHIGKTTFFAWLKTHPKFKEAYDLALPIGEDRFLELPLDKPEIPFPYWHVRMRNQYGYGKKTIANENKLSDSAVLHKINAAWNAYAEGDITAQDYSNVVTASLAELKAIEYSQIKSKENKYIEIDTAELIQRGAGIFSQLQIEFLHSLASTLKKEKEDKILDEGSASV